MLFLYSNLKLSSADDFTDVQWVLGDPMVNFTQSVVDDSIKKNAKFHSDAGMKSVIKRQVKGKAYKWCRGLEGTYDYPKGTPNEVFHRHENCRCVTDYLPGDGKKQNVWSKNWKKEAITQREREKQALEDIKSNNGRTDAQEYRKMVKILGPDKMPPSLPKFQELKYNKDGKSKQQFLKLKIAYKDILLQNDIRNGKYILENNGQQNKHIFGHHDYQPGKSYLLDGVDSQQLVYRYAGKGTILRNKKGVWARKQEQITVKDFAGVNVNIRSNQLEFTRTFNIIYGKTGTHVVPVYDEGG